MKSLGPQWSKSEMSVFMNKDGFFQLLKELTILEWAQQREIVCVSLAKAQMLIVQGILVISNLQNQCIIWVTLIV